MLQQNFLLLGRAAIQFIDLQLCIITKVIFIYSIYNIYICIYSYVIHFTDSRCTL